MSAMEKLVEEGILKFIGVSNFNIFQIEEAKKYLRRIDIVVNQVEYSLVERRIERDLIAYCLKNNITVMAYCPLARGILPKNELLKQIGIKYGKTSAQVALNWLIQKENVVAIPKALNTEHLKENAQATGWRLTEEDLQLINKHFR